MRSSLFHWLCFAENMFQVQRKFVRDGTVSKLSMEAMKEKKRLMVREELKPIHERIDRIENSRMKQAQIATIVCPRAPSARLDETDRMFDEFTERLQKIMLNSQMKSRSFKDI